LTAWRIRRQMTAVLLGVGLFWFAAAPTGALATERPPAQAEPDAARAAREVFQAPDFWWKRIESREISGSWLERFFDALGNLVAHVIDALLDLISRILGSLFGVFTGNWSRGAGLVWLIVAGLLAWSLWKLVPVLVRWLKGDARAPEAKEGVEWQELAEASVLFRQAGQALRDRHYAEAIRLALLALIARLQQQGLLRYDPTRTNREYQMELHAAPELAAPFGQLARIYERVWYGRLPAGRDEAEVAVTLCGSLMNGEASTSE
jgi:uncharacterized protein DUF4129